MSGYSSIDAGFDTTHVPAALNGGRDRSAGVKLAQTAIDLQADGDLREILATLGLKTIADDVDAACGTIAAYRVHVTAGAPVDDECQRAWDAYRTRASRGGQYVESPVRPAKPTKRPSKPQNKTVPNRPVPHGTVGGYNTYRCRCEPCRGAARIYRDARKARQS